MFRIEALPFCFNYLIYNHSLLVFVFDSEAKVISAVLTVVYYDSCQGAALLTHLVPDSCTSHAVSLFHPDVGQNGKNCSALVVTMVLGKSLCNNNMKNTERGHNRIWF